MSAIHEFKCDSCRTRAKAEWNGEHFLYPKDWVEVHNRDVYLVGHLCARCAKRVKLNAGQVKPDPQREDT